MKVSAIVAVAVGLTASLVSAQLESIPPCALGCAINSLGGTGCAQTDIACICSATAFLEALTPCVQTSCTPEEFAATIEAARQLCAAAGVTLSIPTPGPTSTPAEETPTEAPTEAPTVTPPSNSTIVTPPVPSPSSNATATSTEAPSPTEGETEAPSATASQTGAASRNAIALGGLGAAVVAFAAALL